MNGHQFKHILNEKLLKFLDDSSEEKEVDICLFDGKEYKKGQSIPTGDPCNVCTCVEGFKGIINHFLKLINSIRIIQHNY